MKQLLMILLLATGVWGSEGMATFKQKCASCHQLYVPLSQLEENFMRQDNKLLNLKAPTVNQMVYRLKNRIGDPNGDRDMHLMEIESFLEDYFQNPNKDKSVCLPEVLKFFETMPKMDLNDEEFESIVAFLYAYDPKSYQNKTLDYQAFESAKQQAKKQDKMVMIFFTAKHCSFCKKMERNVLSDSEVIAQLDQDVVVVKIDTAVQKSPIAFTPTMTPTFVFLNPQGKELYRVPGAWEKGDFLQILKEAKSKQKTYKSKEK